MGQIYLAPLQNYLQKSLNGAISDNATTITLSSTSGLQAPGVIIVDRVDASGNKLSPALREIIAYTGISVNDLTGCTRGFDQSTAQIHADGAVVETGPTVGMWNNLATIVASGLDNNGYLRAINSPVSLAFPQIIQTAVTSVASIASLFISARLDVSGASITGLGLSPVFRGSGAYSGPTTAIGGIVSTPRVNTYQWFSVITRTVASGGSIVFDFMKNGVSIFAGVTKPTIVGGGTFVSTASINTKNFLPGEVLRFDINTGVGVITDVTGQGGSS